MKFDIDNLPSIAVFRVTDALHADEYAYAMGFIKTTQTYQGGPLWERGRDYMVLDRSENVATIMYGEG